MGCSWTSHVQREPSSVNSKSCNELVDGFLNPRNNNTLEQAELFKESYPEAAEKISKIKLKDLKNLKRFNARVKVMSNPKVAFAAKIMAIRKAKKTIDLSTFILSRDESGYLLLAELKAALERGINIRIMVDSVGSMKGGPLHKELKALMEVQGGFIKKSNGSLSTQRAKIKPIIFNALNPAHRLKARLKKMDAYLFKMFTGMDASHPLSKGGAVNLDRRLHDKILLIDAEINDDAVVFIGGRNIANEDTHITGALKGRNSDMEVVLKNTPGEIDPKENSFSQNVLYYYEKLYYNTENLDLIDALFKIKPHQVKKELDMMNSSQLLEELPNFNSILKGLEKNNYLEKDFESSSIALLNEISNITRKSPFLSPYRNIKQLRKVFSHSISSKVIRKMRTSEKNIKIVSPYLHLTNREINFLKRWLKKDPSRTLEIVTNSKITNNHLVPQAHLDHYLTPKLFGDKSINSQIELNLYGRLDSEKLGGTKNYELLHAKYFIFDDKEVIVGSSNLDARSRYFNSEIAIEMKTADSPQLIEQLKAHYRKLVIDSHLWGSKEWETINESPKLRFYNIIEKFVYQILRVLVYTMPSYKI